MFSRRFVFTLNNFSDAEVSSLRNLGSDPATTYLVFGRETAPSTGTPHLQGFVIFSGPKRLRAAKQALGQRAFIEPARAKSVDAATYCKKEEDYEEYGELPQNQGKRNDFEHLKEWVLAQPNKPTASQVAKEFPHLFIRYARCLEWIDLVYPKPCLVEGTPRPWQQELGERLEGPADDRTIIFVIDPVGGCGKSWFIRWWLSNHSESSQRLSIGKRDDLAYAIDESKEHFLFDVPRSQFEFVQYSVLEQLKDRMVFSPKYNSRNKILAKTPHVVVFGNEEPNRNKLSIDRYEVIRPY